MKFDKKQGSKAGSSSIWVLLLIALAVVAVYLVKNRPETVNRFIPGLLATPTPAPAPEAATAATPEPTPGTPASVSAPVSASVPPAPEVFNITTMTVSELPRTVRILSDENFIIAGGRGSTTARAGTLVSVAARSGEMLTIGYLGGLKQVSYKKTSLENDVQSARMKNIAATNLSTPSSANEKSSGTLPLNARPESVPATRQAPPVVSAPQQESPKSPEPLPPDISGVMSATELARFADADKAGAIAFLTDKQIKVFGTIEKAALDNVASSTDKQVIVTLATSQGLPKVKIRLSPSIAKNPAVFGYYSNFPSWWSGYWGGKVEFQQNTSRSVQVRASYKHTYTSTSTGSVSQSTYKHSTEWSPIFSPGDPMTVEGIFKGIGLDVELGGAYLIDPQNSGNRTPHPVL